MLSLPLSLLLFHTYFSFLTSLSLSLCFSFSSRWIQPRSSQTGEKRQRQQPLTWPPSSHRGDAARVRCPLVLANCRRGWHFTHSWTPPCPKGFVSTQLLMWKSAGKRKRGLRTRWNGNRNQRDAGGKLNLTLKKKNKKKKGEAFFLLSYLRQCILTLHVLLDIDIMWIPLHLTQVCHDMEAATANLYSDSDFSAAVTPEKADLWWVGCRLHTLIVAWTSD